MRIQDNNGFSLIEALLYLTLFGIFIGGAVVGAFNIFESAGRSQTKAELQAEGSFLLAKINWALSGGQSASTGFAGKSLAVIRWGFPDNPVIISQSGASLQISRAGKLGVDLNRADAVLSNLNFIHTAGAGQNPESITTSFTLTARAPNGFLLPQNFSSVKYLRK